MFLNAQALPDRERLIRDICIVGGGAAGLTIAHELGRAGIRVIVLEAGDVVTRRAAQQLYGGSSAGEPYYSLDECRFRLLGGSTGYWGGWCRPLDVYDFEAVDWVADSGWPFDRSMLEPFYRRAQAICGLGPFEYGPGPWRTARESLLVTERTGRFEDAVFQIRPLRFGDVYGKAARASACVDVLINATAVALTVDASGRRVVAVQAATPRRRSIVVSAGVVVIAAGGIENARILLAARRSSRLLRDTGDAVGRYFADHLHVPIGVLRASDSAAAGFYQPRGRHGVTVRGALRLSDAARRAERMLGLGVTLHSLDDPHDVLSISQVSRPYMLLAQAVRAVRHGRLPSAPGTAAAAILGSAPELCRLVYRRYVKRPARAFVIGCRAEQLPNPDSRVTLDAQCDALGLPKARLEWRLSSCDVDTVERGQALLGKALRDHDFEMFPAEAPTGWRRSIAGGAHHMGTTRMHRDPARGVVDEHCRVHGTTNLYVAGSSVFPTSGWAPPTLTIVALALKLADTLAGGLTPREV
jgi:choline dehydrogenase-like flavoprotein